MIAQSSAQNAKDHQDNTSEVHNHEGQEAKYAIIEKSPEDVFEEKIFEITGTDSINYGEKLHHQQSGLAKLDKI